MQKNQEIERLRAIAVIMVVVTHCHGLQDYLPQLFRSSWTGVDLFFVISGFVVSLSLLRLLPNLPNASLAERVSQSKDALRTFYLRRVFRILPACVVWILVYNFLAFFYRNSAASGLFGTPQNLFKETIYFFSGFYNYLRYTNDIRVYYLGPYWSLTVEEHFYFILPWIFILFATRFSKGVAILGGILLVALVLRPFIPVPQNFDPIAFMMFASHRRFDSLFIGVLLALCFPGRGEGGRASGDVGSLSSRILKSILPAFLVFMLWTAPGVLPYPFNLEAGFLVYAFCGAGLVYLASRYEGYIFEFPVIKQILEHIGSRSYAIYLSMSAFTNLQIQWLNIVRPYAPVWLEGTKRGILIQFIWVWIAILIVAELSYRLVEAPMIKFGKRYIGSTRTQATL